MICLLLLLTLYVETNSANKFIKSLTDEYRQAILNRHNAFRRNLPGLDGDSKLCPDKASDMRFIEWDNRLERIAKDWSNKCTKAKGFVLNTNYRNLVFNEFREFLTSLVDKEPTFAQNIALLREERLAKTDVMKMVNGWYAKVKNYNWYTGRCRDDCMSFKIIVDHRISRIGCALGNCEDNLLVCVYDKEEPSANSRFPYTRGKPCDDCLKGGREECKDSLCRVLRRPSPACRDKYKDDAFCTSLLKRIGYQCFPNFPPHNPNKYASAIRDCPARCGVCEEDQGCFDKIDCSDIDSRDCFNPRKGYYKTCRKTCKFCGCRDEKSKQFCKHIEESSSNSLSGCEGDSARYYCRKTCGLCGIKKAPLCIDNETPDFCWKTSVRNKCHENRVVCRATCGECGLF